MFELLKYNRRIKELRKKDLEVDLSISFKEEKLRNIRYRFERENIENEMLLLEFNISKRIANIAAVNDISVLRREIKEEYFKLIELKRTYSDNISEIKQLEKELTDLCNIRDDYDKTLRHFRYLT